MISLKENAVASRINKIGDLFMVIFIPINIGGSTTDHIYVIKASMMVIFKHLVETAIAKALPLMRF